MKKITIGVPTYHAHSTLPKLLSSLQTQTMSEDIAIILANDDPKDNGTYKNIKKLFPDLDIEILNCDKNTGPGLAR